VETVEVKKSCDFNATSNSAYPDPLAETALAHGNHFDTICESGIAIETIALNFERIGFDSFGPEMKRSRAIPMSDHYLIPRLS